MLLLCSISRVDSHHIRAQSIKNGKLLAIKCMKSHFDNLEQVWLIDGIGPCFEAHKLLCTLWLLQLCCCAVRSTAFVRYRRCEGCPHTRTS